MPLASATRRYTEAGHEPALANALAERIKRAPQFIALSRDEQLAALTQGRVDVVLARADILPDALPDGIIALRSGYRSGLAAAMRSDTTIRTWQDLQGRAVCVTGAGHEAEAVARRHGARIERVDAPAQALVRLRLGQCEASLHDAAQLEALLSRDDWQKFSATLPAIDTTELVLLAHQPDRALQQAVRAEAEPQRWQARNARWAANIAFEVYFDQMGPDCH